MKFCFPWGNPRALYLEDGFIAFTLDDGSLVFRAPLQEVRASFPKVTFLVFIPLFGIGINLASGGNTYRLSFVPFGYGSVGGRMGWTFGWGDVKQARATVRQWRAVLGQPAKEPLQLRCLECGAETAEAAQVCARCGAPVAH